MREPVLLVLLLFILTSISRLCPGFTLVIWDIQTGVIVGEPDIGHTDRLLFHGNHRTITFVSWPEYLYVYHVHRGTQICYDLALPPGTQLGGHWTHKSTLLLATSVQTDRECVISLCTLQPTSTPPLCILDSFRVPPYSGLFSFSPASFHACFLAEELVIILDIQDSKLLLQITKEEVAYKPLGQFSPDGRFFACGVSPWEIRVWQNTPTGYVAWGGLRPRLSFWEFSWSPNSMSILCQCTGGLLLLDPVNYPSPLSPNRNEPNSQDGVHLVAYSVDQVHIAVAPQEGSDIMVLNTLLDTTWQFIKTDMKIHDIKIIGNTIFAVDKRKLVGWELKAGGTGPFGLPFWLSSSTTWRVTYSKSLFIGHVEHLRLSHDCTQVAFAKTGLVCLYDIKAQEVLKSMKWEWDTTPEDIQFSPDGHQLHIAGQAAFDTFFYYAVELSVEDWGFVDLKDGWSWANHFSSCRYHVREGSAWVMDSRGRKLLWLLPDWRASDWKEVKWQGNLLTLVGAHNPVPIIIKFQPQHLLPHSY